MWRCITVIPTGHVQGVLQWTYWASKFSKNLGGTHPVRGQRWTLLASHRPRRRSSFSWDHTWCLRLPRPPSHSSGIHRCPKTQTRISKTKDRSNPMSLWRKGLDENSHSVTEAFQNDNGKLLCFVNPCNEQTWDVFGCCLCSLHFSKAFKNMSNVSIIKCEWINLLGPWAHRRP